MSLENVWVLSKCAYFKFGMESLAPMAKPSRKVQKHQFSYSRGGHSEEGNVVKVKKYISQNTFKNQIYILRVIYSISLAKENLHCEI